MMKKTCNTYLVLKSQSMVQISAFQKLQAKVILTDQQKNVVSVDLNDWLHPMIFLPFFSGQNIWRAAWLADSDQKI